MTENKDDLKANGDPLQDKSFHSLTALAIHSESASQPVHYLFRIEKETDNHYKSGKKCNDYRDSCFHNSLHYPENIYKPVANIE